MSSRHQTVAKALGYSGLLPFVVLASLYAAGEIGDFSRSLMGIYSLGILLFLCGSWWGIALMRRRWQELVVSNLLFLGMVAAFQFLPARIWFAVSGIGFLGLYYLEGVFEAFQSQPPYYRQLRRNLSLVAAVSMVPFVLA